MKLRDDVPEPIRRVGARLKGFLQQGGDLGDEQAEAARRRFEKAVFHSRYSVEQFEAALDEHRHKMRELGDAIAKLLKEFNKEWDRGKKRGEHRGYANRAIAKTYFRRIIGLEERIDAHLSQFEKKLNVLTAWRQHKIENDIGAEVDVGEVHQWISEEFDQFEMQNQSFEAEEAEQILQGQRSANGGSVISDEEEELLDEFVEKEFGDEESTERENGAFGTVEQRATPDSGEVDEEIEAFLQNEVN